MKPNWKDIKKEFLTSVNCPCTRCQMLVSFETQLRFFIENPLFHGMTRTEGVLHLAKEILGEEDV